MIGEYYCRQNWVALRLTKRRGKTKVAVRGLLNPSGETLVFAT